MKKSSHNRMWVFVGIGMELVAIELTLIFIGYQIDQKMAWPGLALACGAILGLTIWLYHVIKLLRSYSEGTDSDENEESLEP